MDIDFCPMILYFLLLFLLEILILLDYEWKNVGLIR
jgi:hypothetical protein